MEPGESGLPLDHLLHGVGAVDFEEDLVPLHRSGAPVAVRPLVAVANGTDGVHVHGRCQQALSRLLGNVGERQVADVEVVEVLADDDAEGAHDSRPAHVGERPVLAAALEDALVHGAELVHVVALVGAAAGVVEGVDPGNQQRALVVGDGVGASEDGTGFTVEALAVGEEQGVFGRELLAQLNPLAGEGGQQHDAVLDTGALGDDEVLRHYTGADSSRRYLLAEDGAVAQSLGA